MHFLTSRIEIATVLGYFPRLIAVTHDCPKEIGFICKKSDSDTKTLKSLISVDRIKNW